MFYVLEQFRGMCNEAFNIFGIRSRSHESPAEDRSCNIDLTIVGSKDRIVLTKRGDDLQTEYVLRMPVASSIGLTTLDQRDNEQAIKDLVLALGDSANLLT